MFTWHYTHTYIHNVDEHIFRRYNLFVPHRHVPRARQDQPVAAGTYYVYNIVIYVLYIYCNICIKHLIYSSRTDMSHAPDRISPSPPRLGRPQVARERTLFLFITLLSLLLPLLLLLPFIIIIIIIIETIVAAAVVKSCSENGMGEQGMKERIMPPPIPSPPPNPTVFSLHTNMPRT
jgi:hypothetical protein